jgi:mannose-6-phosphate isomerase-like protein (cupin superfamily)
MPFIPISDATISNNNYRKVEYTGQFQLVLMSLKPLEEIGEEIHPDTDQFIRIERGRAEATIDDEIYKLKSGDSVIFPAGALHNIRNVSKTRPLKLYTIYSPPEHPPKTRQRNKPRNEHH